MKYQKKENILLGVNIDHIASLRESRKTNYPDIIKAAKIIKNSGADKITVHLREDRRHIQDVDVFELVKIFPDCLNLEISISKEMINIAEKIKPKYCCLVPEKRKELTTEKGLDILNNLFSIKMAYKKLHNAGIITSVFIDPNYLQIKCAKNIGLNIIEIHTGYYASSNSYNKKKELQLIKNSIKYAKKLGMIIHAGHGLNQENIHAIASIPEIQELNIGHSIISDSIFLGLKKAILNIKLSIINARK